MSDTTSAATNNQLQGGTKTYENSRVVIRPQTLDHYEVVVTEPDGGPYRHAVERVVVNSATVLLDSPIWFVDATIDVGVPMGEPGDTVWVWP
jgi:hypothetical protein